MNKNTAIAFGVLVAFALVLFAFVPPPAPTIITPVPDTQVQIYEGITPCADCPGITQRLILTPAQAGAAEGTYELSLTYLDRDVEPFIETGVWTTERGTPTDENATVVALYREGADTPQRLRRIDATSLRFLDMDGNEIDSNLPFTLSAI